MTRRPEDQLQGAVVDYLRARGVLAVAVPNAAVRRAGARAGNAVPGLTPGFPDLLVFAGRGLVLAIELKAPPRRLRSGRLSKASPRVSDEQRAMMDELARRGVASAVCRSVDDVEAFLTAHNVLFKGRRI